MYTSFHIILIVLASVILIKIILFIYNYIKLIRKHLAFSKKLSGPPAWPIIGNAMDLAYLTESDIMYKFIDLHKIYGNILRFWLGPQLTIFINEPKYIEQVLKSSKAAVKAPLYKYVASFIGHGLLGGSGQLRKDHRKAVVPTLNVNYLEANYLQTINKQCNILLERLRPLENEKTFNMWNKITLCTLDIANEALLGIEGFSQDEKYLPLAVSFEKCSSIATQRMTNVIYHSDILYNFSKISKEEKAAIALQDNFSQKVLEKKDYLRNCKNPEKSVDRILTVNNLSDYDRVKSVTNLCIVSQDSTATIISFLLLMLAIHQDIQKKVYEEIDSFLDSSSDFEVKLDLLNSFKYLDICIKETLRLYPAGPILLRDIKEDFKLSDELTIPGGSIIGIFVFGLHRDPNIWTNAEKFIPERFLHSEEVKRHPSSYIPFSAGPMSCVGKTFAEVVMKSISVAILREYRIETDLKSIDDVKLKIAVSTRSENGYPVRLVPRRYCKNKN